MIARRALVMGSFDPVTLGHMLLINEAAKLANTVYVCVMISEEKVPLYSLFDRIKMLEIALFSDTQRRNWTANERDVVMMTGRMKSDSTDINTRIVLDNYGGMCYEYCIKNEIDLIVRGYRNDVDLAYEKDMADYNREHCGVNTILIESPIELKSISSSYARANISRAVTELILPKGVAEYIVANTEVE